MDISDDFRAAMEAFANRDYLKSIGFLDKVLNSQPDHALAMTTRGAAYLRQGDFDSAAADFNRVIAVDPDHARGYHLRGIARTEKGDHAGALADFNQAIALDPDYGAAYNSRAHLNSKLGRTTAAQEDVAVVTHLTLRNIERFGNENNVWQTQHFAVEAAMETELNR